MELLVMALGVVDEAVVNVKVVHALPVHSSIVTYIANVATDLT